MLTSQKTTVVSVTPLVRQPSETKRIEDARSKDILLLLENLAEREEATIKMILDCLYDIGSARLINNKVPIPVANQMVKKIAKLSKPGFRAIAFYWFKKNCPQLITNWLLNKIRRTLK